MSAVGTYHHGNLRTSLIETGVDLARTDGPDGVVLREVARRTGVSHNAAYRHFADREALLAEIAEVGMQRLGEAMLADMDAVTETEPLARATARLRACGRAYVHFALAEPGLFTVAFATATPAPDGTDAADEPPEVHDPYGLLGRALDELEAAGALGQGRREGAEVLCWAAVHGYAVLHLDGPLRDVPETELEAGLQSLLDQVERGLI
jgi:AcrR family transcriptional regulator